MVRIILSTLVLILITACATESEIEIFNDTENSVSFVLGDRIYHLLPADPPAAQTFYVNSYILFSETLKVPFILEGQVFLESKEKVFRIKANVNKKYHITFDRAGLQISNPSVYTISAVYLRREGDDDWGDSIIEEPIYSENISSVLSVEPDFNYIKITDSFGSEFQEEALDLQVGETTIYIFGL
ncbi:MAG: hypothetical protein K9N07_02300 [Candidatus Cloacimonetes bacterium]|nr:hypothetical protein [Candidatus Cloacimonadota bacterium]